MTSFIRFLVMFVVVTLFFVFLSLRCLVSVIVSHDEITVSLVSSSSSSVCCVLAGTPAGVGR